MVTASENFPVSIFLVSEGHRKISRRVISSTLRIQKDRSPRAALISSRKFPRSSDYSLQSRRFRASPPASLRGDPKSDWRTSLWGWISLAWNSQRFIYTACTRCDPNRVSGLSCKTTWGSKGEILDTLQTRLAFFIVYISIGDLFTYQPAFPRRGRDSS